MISGIEQLVAIATDTPVQIAVPQFGLDDAIQIVDFIENRFLKDPDRSTRSPK